MRKNQSFECEREVTMLLLLVVYLTLTDPLRIQPWSQDRRNQTKSNRKSEISRGSRQKRTDKKQTGGNRIKRRKGSPISSGIQPRHEDKGKGNGCNTKRNKNTDGEKETTIK